MAEEWVKNSREEVNVEVQSHLTIEKAVGVLRLEKESLSEKVKEAIKARDSVEDCRFSATGRTQKRDELALADGEINPIQRPDFGLS